MYELAERLEVSNKLDQQERLKNDVQTLMAEMLNGSMRTEFVYQFDGQELYGQDGGAMGTVFRDAGNEAQKLAETDPSLSFEVRRRQHEQAEYHDMLAMADKKLPNTMIVVSDFPPELMYAKNDVGGYNVERKQTMLRVITRRRDGTIAMVSQSLDKSDRAALEALYYDRGFVPKPGELLGQRMRLDMPETAQENMVDYLAGVYDQTLQKQYGGNWQAGRSSPFGKNTYDFVRDQGDLIRATTLGLNHINDITKDNLYNLAAALQRRYEGLLTPRSISYEQIIIGNPMMLPTQELYQAGQIARIEGRSFSGCGVTVKGPGSGGIEQELGELGYGNKAGDDEDGPDGLGPLKFKCKYGHWNIRPQGKLIAECQFSNCKKGSVGC